MMNLLKIIMIAQLFYAFSITTIVYAIDQNPDTDLSTRATEFQDLGEEISLESASTDIEESLLAQTNIPVVDVGSLIFYSGNLLIDLLLNFAFAIPQMITLLISSIFDLLQVNYKIAELIQIFLSVLISGLYALGVIQLLVGVRSGRVV